MTQFCRDDFERNWLWLATDQVGSLGLFQSFGEAPLPKSVTSSLEDADVVDDFITADLLTRVGACESRLFQERGWYVGGVESSISKFLGWEANRDVQTEQKQLRERMDALLRSATCGLHI